MLKVGITGNIASGKSQVEKIIKNKGFLVYDLDLISHDLLVNNKDVKSQIIKHFKTIDRKSLGEIIFNNPIKKKELENIVHPKLKEFCLNVFNQETDIIFISGALLYEANFDTLFDKIIYVDSKKETRLKRLMERNSLNETQAKTRIESQNTIYKSKADFVIDNNETIEALTIKVNSILHELTCNK